MFVSIRSVGKTCVSEAWLQPAVFWDKWGGVISADKHPSYNRAASCIFKWKIRSALHNQEWRNHRERLSSLPGRQLGLLSWQPKHSHQPSPQAGSSSHPWLYHDLFFSPSNLSRVLPSSSQAAVGFLFIAHLQAATGFCSFPFGRVETSSPARWLLSCFPPSSVWLTQGFTNLPFHRERASISLAHLVVQQP